MKQTSPSRRTSRTRLRASGLPEPDDLLDDSDLEMIEGSALMAESDDEVDPDEEFDVEPDGEDPDEEDDDA